MLPHGTFPVLIETTEAGISFSTAAGTGVLRNPLPVLKQIGAGLAGVFAGSRYTKAFYLETLKMLYDLFTLPRKAGTAKLEEEVDNPDKGVVFTKYPKIVKDHHALHF